MGTVVKSERILTEVDEKLNAMCKTYFLLFFAFLGASTHSESNSADRRIGAMSNLQGDMNYTSNRLMNRFL